MTNTRIVVDHYGGPDELRVVEEESREPKRGEVRVKVLAAGVSLPDVMMREGIGPRMWPLLDLRSEGATGVDGEWPLPFALRLLTRPATPAAAQ